MPLEAGEGRQRAAEAEPEGETAAREQCPRCESRNTKFCYYNNYNTSQPRHFCKSCRRYWTLGGSLRNVPIGGASRKRLRPSRATGAAPGTAAAAIMRPMCALSSITPVAPPPLDMAGPYAPASSGQGLIFSGAAQTGFLALGEPFLAGRAGFGLGLGLGLGCGDSGPYPSSIEEMGFGVGPTLLLPSSLLEDTWRMGNGKGEYFGVPSPSATGPLVWPDLAVPAEGRGGGGGSASELR